LSGATALLFRGVQKAMEENRIMTMELESAREKYQPISEAGLSVTTTDLQASPVDYSKLVVAGSTPSADFGFPNVALAFKTGDAKEPVDAESGSTVYADGKTTVIAKEGSTVYAQDGASVTAKAGSTVYAEKDSTVCAEKGATVFAKQGSTVLAMDGTTVNKDKDPTIHQEKGASVQAHNGAKISAYKDALVDCYDAQVTAYDGSTVWARTGQNNAGPWKSTVIAKGNCEIWAKKDANVNIEPGSTVKLHNWN
jgi:hypothetical protein